MALTFRAVSSGGGLVGASRAVSKPSGALENDIVLVHIRTDGDVTVSAPDGSWDLEGSLTGAGNIFVFSKVLGASEPGTWTFTFGASTTSSYGAIAWYSSTATALVTGTAVTQNNGSGTSHVCPSIDTVYVDPALHCFLSLSAGVTDVTPDGAMTERYQAYTARTYLMTQNITSSTPITTGTRTATSTTEVSSRALSIEVAEDVAATPPTVEDSFTADAIVQRTEADSFDVDAIVQRNEPDSFTADAIVKATRSGTFDADAIIQRTEGNTFTADAYVLVTPGGSFTADAIVKATQLASFVADATVRRTEGDTFDVDAYVRRTEGDAFSLDAIVLATQGASFAADAIVRTAPTTGFAIDAYVRVGPPLSATATSARYARLITQMFNYLWRFHGRPTLFVYDPVTAWSLPAGVSYDKHQDQFIDGDGDVQAINWYGQPHTEIHCLPVVQDNAVTLSIPGVVTTTQTGTVVVALWTQAVQALIAAAWGVVLDQALYRVERWDVFPEGSEPVVIRIDLTEAE